MSDKTDIVEGAVAKGEKSIGALGITGIGATVLILVIVLAQMSGGIKLLGDWTDRYKQSAKNELTLSNTIKSLKETSARNRNYITRHCQDHRDHGQRWADCSALSNTQADQ